ncbi:hypothetical protein F5B20DRAFT_539177 [Whalleya microplaca]|nr:hypothetical protein F5B20DRAFT_539177 [Whalleya microplaca]
MHILQVQPNGAYQVVTEGCVGLVSIPIYFKTVAVFVIRKSCVILPSPASLAQRQNIESGCLGWSVYLSAICQYILVIIGISLFLSLQPIVRSPAKTPDRRSGHATDSATRYLACWKPMMQQAVPEDLFQTTWRKNGLIMDTSMRLKRVFF